MTNNYSKYPELDPELERIQTVDEAIAEALTCECIKDKVCDKCNFEKENNKPKIGDIIEWDFKDKCFKDYPKHLKNKTFQAPISMINEDEQHYGVYAEYGQDLIPFNNCKVVR